MSPRDPKQSPPGGRRHSAVLGANGFLGSRLVDALVEAGHSVTAFDRYSSGVRRHRTDPDRVVVGDFLNAADLRTAVRDQDNVFHFLSLTSPATVDAEPLLDIRTNVEYSVSLFQACVDAGIQRLTFASSGGTVYGESGSHAHREDDLPLPVSPYGIGKLTIEHYLRYFRAKHGLDSIALRIANPFGPGQHPGRRQGFIPIALDRIRRGLPVDRIGDGSMVRDYLYVDDAIDMVVAAASAGSPSHDVYNIGSGSGRSVTEVLDSMRSAVGHDFEIIEREAPMTFVHTSVLDTSRYSEEFGIRPMVSLDEGIRRTWEWLA